MSSFILLCFVVACLALASAQVTEESRKRAPPLALFNCEVSTALHAWAHKSNYLEVAQKLLQFGCDEKSKASIRDGSAVDPVNCMQKVKDMENTIKLLAGIAKTCKVKTPPIPHQVAASSLRAPPAAIAGLAGAPAPAAAYGLNLASSPSGQDDSTYTCGSQCVSSMTCIEQCGGAIASCSTVELDPLSIASCLQDAAPCFEGTQQCCFCLAYYEIVDCGFCWAV